MARSLKDMQNETISFAYKNNRYEVPIVDSLSLKDMSVVEIKDGLNEISARLAFWSSLQITVEREIADMEENYDLWFSERYAEVDKSDPKKTEGWKKTRIMLDNAEEYRKRQGALRDLQDVNKKLSVLTKAYNNVIWTFREIARLTHSELSSLSNSSLKSSGTLADL